MDKGVILAAGAGILTAVTTALLARKSDKSGTEVIQEVVEEEEQEEVNREEEVRAQFAITKNVPYPRFEQKLVVCLRNDIKLKTSHFSSLLGDAVVRQCMKMKHINETSLGQWYRYGQAKIALKVPNREVMDSLIASATENNIPFTVMENEGEPIALALGPGQKSEIDKVSGKLKLL